jgi:hypothetical protein
MALTIYLTQMEDIMCNSTTVQLDVLTWSEEEIRQIDVAVRDPSKKVISRIIHPLDDSDQSAVEEVVTSIRLTPINNLGLLDPSGYGGCRFRGIWEEKYLNVGFKHLLAVSGRFGRALFLAHYSDDMTDVGGSKVIHSGRVTRCLVDGTSAVRSPDWARLDITSPFRVEHELGCEYGSLWNLWMRDMREQLASLSDRYGEPDGDPRG